jgi:ubiquitin C-terminal hydrolase
MDFAKIDDIVEIKPVLNVPCKNDSTHGTYKLYGIVHHFGTKNNGHYISQVLDETNGA